MKNSRKNILYLVIIVLVIVIAILAGVIIKNSNSKIGEQEQGSIEKLTEATSNNAYVDMATHLSEIGTIIDSDFEILLQSGTSFTVTEEYNGKKGIIIATCSSGSRDNAASLTMTLNGFVNYSKYTLVSNYYNKTYVYYGEFQEGNIKVVENSPDGGTYNVAKITVLCK